MYWLFGPLVIGVGKAFLLVGSRVVLPEQKSNQQSLHSHTHTHRKKVVESWEIWWSAHWLFGLLVSGVCFSLVGSRVVLPGQERESEKVGGSWDIWWVECSVLFSPLVIDVGFSVVGPEWCCQGKR